MMTEKPDRKPDLVLVLYEQCAMISAWRTPSGVFVQSEGLGLHGDEYELTAVQARELLALAEPDGA
jgi:hypothetical protein